MTDLQKSKLIEMIIELNTLNYQAGIKTNRNFYTKGEDELAFREATKKFSEILVYIESN